MPIFKYTVANREGKKLSGTVEAPNEETARKELNNLGFSILALQITEQPTIEDKGLPKFVFEAVDKNSKLVAGTIPAQTQQEALIRLEDEYSLTITAIWKENATEDQIIKAKKEGSARLQDKLSQQLENQKNKNLQQQKEEQFVKTKIETILKQVNEILQKFDEEFDAEQKAEVNKRINKLLRIKHSTNLDYILSTAHDLLHFLEKQEKLLKEKGFSEKEFMLKVRTKKLLDELNTGSGPKSISEDIVNRINDWESAHKRDKSPSITTKFLGRILLRIKDVFRTPPEIQVIKDQIHVYNKQLIEFIKLYFKEPTPEYKAKVKLTLGTIWRARKKAKSSLRYVKKILKERKKTEPTEEYFTFSVIQEINALTGWLLFFYITYYFTSLYLNTKDFGLSTIPKGFNIYDTHLFKYILVIVFLAHLTTSVKINFLRKSFVANIILPIFFVFGVITTLLNF